MTYPSVITCKDQRFYSHLGEKKISFRQSLPSAGKCLKFPGRSAVHLWEKLGQAVFPDPFQDSDNDGWPAGVKGQGCSTGSGALAAPANRTSAHL